MKFTMGLFNRNAVTLQPAVLLYTLIVTTSCSPVRHRSSVTSGSTWLMTSQGSTKSHLMMWMMTEKQLIPQIEGLAEAAFGLLMCTCEKEGKSGVEDCLSLATSLPDTRGLHHVPSQQVMDNEGSKTFVKMLLENAYSTLVQLMPLLKNNIRPAGLGECRVEQNAGSFMHGLESASTQYRNMMVSFYQTNQAVPKTVKNATITREEFSSDRQLAVRLLYTAVNSLRQVSSALEYSVELSWFSRQVAMRCTGRAGKCRRRRNRKDRKTQ